MDFDGFDGFLMELMDFLMDFDGFCVGFDGFWPR